MKVLPARFFTLASALLLTLLVASSVVAAPEQAASVVAKPAAPGTSLDAVAALAASSKIAAPAAPSASLDAIAALAASSKIAAAPAAPAAAAEEVITGTGGFRSNAASLYIYNENRPANEPPALSRGLTGSLTGVLSGTVATVERIVVTSVGPGAGDFTFTFKSTQTCSCEIKGHKGTVTMLLEGSGDQVKFSGTYKLLSEAGAGDLALLRGSGTLDGFRGDDPTTPQAEGGYGTYTANFTYGNQVFLSMVANNGK